jgi:hypothetical protein
MDHPSWFAKYREFIRLWIIVIITTVVIIYYITTKKSEKQEFTPMSHTLFGFESKEMLGNRGSHVLLQ